MRAWSMVLPAGIPQGLQSLEYPLGAHSELNSNTYRSRAEKLPATEKTNPRGERNLTHTHTRTATGHKSQLAAALHETTEGAPEVSFSIPTSTAPIPSHSSRGELAQPRRGARGRPYHCGSTNRSHAAFVLSSQALQVRFFVQPN